MAGFTLLFNSVSIKSLDAVKRERVLASFKPADFARDFWDNALLKHLHQAVDAKAFLTQLAEDPEKAREKFARQMGIGAYFGFLSGEGEILRVDEEGVLLSILTPENEGDILVKTGFIFGNAIRDASGLLNVNDFPNSTDFNNVSTEINRIVTKEVIPSFKRLVKPGQRLIFVGASELTRVGNTGKPLQVVPITVRVK